MELTSLVRAAKGSREQQVNSVTGGSCPFCLQAPASRDGPTDMGNSSRGRPGGDSAPAGPDLARTRSQGWRAQLPQGQRPSHPSLTASRNFLDCKKKNKAQAKSVINIRANSKEFGQPQGSAAPTRTSTASLEGTGSSGGGTAPPQHQSCSQPSLAAQGALHSSLSFLEAANFSQTTCQLTKPFVLLWYVSFPYHEKLGQVFPLVFFPPWKRQP